MMMHGALAGLAAAVLLGRILAAGPLCHLSAALAASSNLPYDRLRLAGRRIDPAHTSLGVP